MLKKYIFGLLNAIGISSLLRLQKKNTLTVLSLHRISDDRDYFWNPITPATFEKLLQYVAKYYSIISFSDVPHLRKDPSSKPYLILSFDDGYSDFYDHALPLLKKYNLPCNHNIVNNCATNNQIIWTQRLNHIFNYCRDRNINLSFDFKDNKIAFESFNNNWMNFYLDIFKSLLETAKIEREHILEEKEKEYSINPFCKMMNWEQILECSENLVEIGCHTYSHDLLSTIDDVEILRKEILKSTQEIESRINKKINILALPNGQGNEQIKQIISESGLKYILSVEDKVNNIAELGNCSTYNIFRINMLEESHAEMILRIELLHSKIRRYV
jgi:peptidoglycan/xylan/chitin deacetylase (PgdA/CDA1 family)